MASLPLTVAFTPSTLCAGGEHFHVDYVIDGFVGTLHVEKTPTWATPLTAEEYHVLAGLLMRLQARQAPDANSAPTRIAARMVDLGVDLAAVL